MGLDPTIKVPKGHGKRAVKPTQPAPPKPAHPTDGPVIVSARFNALRRLGRFTHRISQEMKVLDPYVYQYGMALQAKTAAANAACEAAQAPWHGSMYSTHSIVYNRSTGLHRDRHNPPALMDTLLVGGDFTGGDFLVPELGLRIPYGPGTLLISRGGCMVHGVADWEPVGNGKRYALASYIQEAASMLAAEHLCLGLPVVQHTLSA